ncbi:MAG: hypothetical protein ACKOB1_04440 [Planctomycetia bacterium]
MGFPYWFVPGSCRSFDIVEPENDEVFESRLYNRIFLELESSECAEILCADASRLTSAALNFFLKPEFDVLCDRVVGLRFRHFTAANAQTLVPVVEKLPNLRSLELLKDFSLDRDCIDVLSGLPRLRELAAGKLTATEASPRHVVIEHLASLKALEHLAVPRCCLELDEIAAIIDACGLYVLEVGNDYDEDSEKALQAPHRNCTIGWGFLA